MRDIENRSAVALDQSQPADAVAPSRNTRARVDLVDALRGFALFGIFLVNLGGFSFYGPAPAEMRASISTAATDWWVGFAILWLGYGKFNTIFSFLFGLGFSLLLLKEHERGIDFGRFYRRRMTALLLIGLVHLTLFWEGDILALYALMGFVLMAFRRASDRSLLIWAGALLASHLVITALRVLSNGTLDPGAPLMRAAIWFATSVLGLSEDAYFRTFAEGSWLEVLRGNLAGALFRYSYLLSTSRFQRVLGMFLIGLWVGRQAILADPASHRMLLRRVMLWGFPIGLFANVVVAWVELEQPPNAAIAIGETAAYVIGVAPLAMAYVAAFSLLWLRSSWQPLLASLAPAGRMALTCYLTQTLIGIGLFYGVGLGWAGKVGPTLFPVITVVVVVLQVAFCNWWLKRFRFGPVEWLWRSLTYGEIQSMRVRAAAHAGVTAV